MKPNLENQLDPVMDKFLACHWDSHLEHLNVMWLVKYLEKYWDAHSKKLMDYH